MYFSFDFGLVRPSWFCPLRTGRVGEGRLLHGQNPLSVTNVICWQTLKVCFVQKFNSNKVFQILNLCFVKHWILNWQNFTENQEEITSWSPPPRQCQRSKFVILFKSSLHPYLSLHGKPFFFPDVLKIWSFQKNALEFDLSCIIGKYDVYFSRKYDLTPRRKMKDDLSQRNTRKYGIFFKCSEKMVFSKRTEPGHDLSCTSWKGGFFFSLYGKRERDDFSREIHGNMIFSIWYVPRPPAKKKIKDDPMLQKYT